MTTKNWTQLHPKYSGKWVAFSDDHQTVISSAIALKTVISQAKRLGIDNPLVFKVPSRNLPYVGQI